MKGRAPVGHLAEARLVALIVSSCLAGCAMPSLPIIPDAGQDAASAGSGIDLGIVDAALQPDLVPVVCPMPLPSPDAGCGEITTLGNQWLDCSSTCTKDSDCILVHVIGECSVCETSASIRSLGPYLDLLTARSTDLANRHLCGNSCSCGVYPPVLPCINGRCP
jgi:hypothetical protein